MKKIITIDATLKTIEKENFTFRERLNLCALLDKSGVDIIYLPFPGVSKESEVIYKTLAESVKNAKVAVEVGDSEKGIERAYACVKGAVAPALVVSMPVSTATMEYKYHLKASAMLEKIALLTECAKAKCSEVFVMLTDAFRAEEGFIEKCVKAVEEKGASGVIIYDEAGEAFPEDYAKMLEKINTVSKISVIACPSDALSLASANAIKAIESGADGVVTSISGAFLRPAVFAEVIRAKGGTLNASANIDITSIKNISEQASAVTEKESEEEEKTVKLSSSSTLSEVSAVIKSLGYELTDEDTGKVYDEFKRLTVRKKSVDKRELEAVIASTAMQAPSTYHLVSYVVNSGSIISATANVTLEKNGERFSGVSTGDGPIDAVFHAIEQVVGHHYELDDFRISAITKGREAVGSAIIRLRANGKLYPGNGVSTDIIGACVRAYVNALNKIVHEEK